MNAPFRPDGWNNAIDMIARATWSRGSNLVCLGEGVPSLNLISGFDQDEVSDFFTDPQLWGSSNWRVGTTTKPFDIQHDVHYRSYREDRACGPYDEAAFHLDMEHGCQTIFSHDVAGFIGLAVLRSRRDGPADPDSVGRFEYLSTIIARALKVEMAMAGEGIRVMLGGARAAGGPLVLVNRHGWACGMSPAAESMIDAGRPIRCRGPRLAMADPLDDLRFQQVLAFMLHHDRDAGHAVQLRIGDKARTSWTVTVAHLPPGELSLGFDPHVTVIVERVVS